MGWCVCVRYSMACVRYVAMGAQPLIHFCLHKSPVAPRPYLTPIDYHLYMVAELVFHVRINC